MNRNDVKKRLHHMIGLDSLHSWDIDTHIDLLADLPEETQEEIFRQITAIWPVSYALCFAFLEQLPKGLACLHSSQLAAWVNATLDVYEERGLQAANRFLTEVENNFACKLENTPGLSFDEVKGRLHPYLTGLAGYEIALAVGVAPSTDTTTIFLEPDIASFESKEQNFLLYKLTTSMQWALIVNGLFRLQIPPEDPLLVTISDRYQTNWPKKNSWLGNFFALFPQPELAADLFLLAESVRAATFLRRELPGLIRDAEPLRRSLNELRPDCTALGGAAKFVEGLKQWALGGTVNGNWTKAELKTRKVAEEQLAHLAENTATARDSAAFTGAVYAEFDNLRPDYQGTAPIAYVGVLKPEEAELARKQRRAENRKLFINSLAALLPEAKTADEQTAPPPAPEPSASKTNEEQAATIPPGNKEKSRPAPPPDSSQPQTFITINDEQMRLPDSIQPLAKEISNDLGHIPQEYISSASQRAGSGIIHGSVGAQGEESLIKTASTLCFDEWDFRRAGFRKNWCSLHNKELLPVKGTFIKETMTKYRGQLRRLRRQFEMMRSQQRFVKRQRDSDDIDLDAIIESQADMLANLPPSERLYIKLIRDQRNINAIFLVDMSSSTEGWIGTAIKESLLLMCEALTVLGDQYGIYGFSGMRRNRSELYHIKHLDEPYDETVRGRITAITPKEYTRMGPPIRHLTNLLAESDAATRLLITLSDGKPEDYDDYKGDYATEDTRHALIEAKNRGIHPFCITIDRRAHDYIAHMYGEINYIVIDNVKKLPGRMPQIYRNLTT
ncbi:MAG: VWA domain-containing protein [Desulfobulbaceae bacterium]|nr:VWA domain-containing protein [Desulfobulbaceae bacterium]